MRIEVKYAFESDREHRLEVLADVQSVREKLTGHPDDRHEGSLEVDVVMVRVLRKDKARAVPVKLINKLTDTVSFFDAVIEKIREG